MVDEIDRANKEVEMLLADASRMRKQEAPGYTGHCFWCDEKLPSPRRFCDADCRDEWEASK